MNGRLFWLKVIFLILTAAVIARLFTLQVLGNGYYRNLAENQHQLYKTLVPSRGEVFIGSKTGELIPVVKNIEVDLVYAVPPEILDKEQTASLLAPILEMTRQEILEKISQEDRKWVSIRKQLLESQSNKIRDLKLDGIYLQPEAYRFYPEKNFAAQVLGFYAYVGDERAGRYGIEGYFEEALAGKAGSLSGITGGTRDLEPAQDGHDVILTLDRAIQFKAEAILLDTVTKHEAQGGSIVVMNPETGAILAMANFPGFDPNNFSKVEDQSVYRNRATSDAYEPGSVFKPITMAAALDAGSISPDTTYEDTGVVVLDKFSIKNSDNKAHGTQTMTQVLEKSLNTGAIFAQQKLGKEGFLEAVKRFGFGQLTDITLPAEVAGDIRNLENGGDVHYATASFGQGITITMLQLAQAFGVFANQGKMMRPYVVEGEGLRQADQVISARTANTISAMLVSVVENGHGRRAGVPGYYVAGKTGTAQVARSDGPGYDPDLTIGTFAGFAPVQDPVFVAVVRIDNPKYVRFAESTAAPAFGELAKFLLNYYQIRPSR